MIFQHGDFIILLSYWPSGLPLVHTLQSITRKTERQPIQRRRTYAEIRLQCTYELTNCISLENGRTHSYTLLSFVLKNVTAKVNLVCNNWNAQITLKINCGINVIWSLMQTPFSNIRSRMMPMCSLLSIAIVIVLLIVPFMEIETRLTKLNIWSFLRWLQ